MRVLNDFEAAAFSLLNSFSQQLQDELLAEKLDRYLGRLFLDRLLNFLSGFCEPVCIDIDSNSATGTGHVLLRLEPSDGLLQFVPAARTLEPDFMRVHVGHPGPPSSRCLRLIWTSQVTEQDDDLRLKKYICRQHCIVHASTIDACGSLNDEHSNYILLILEI
jgi:hypothetical protein